MNNRIKQKILDQQKISLSNDDVLNLVNHESNLVTYPQIAHFKTLDELMGEYGCCVILFMTKKRYGHWTCLFRVDDNTVEFFDSYGYIPDDEKSFIENNFLKDSNQKRNYLSELLLQSGYKVIYNEYKLQKKKPGINTCGYHVCVRINNRLIPHKEYIKLIKSSKKYDPDYLVTGICMSY